MASWLSLIGFMPWILFGVVDSQSDVDTLLREGQSLMQADNPQAAASRFEDALAKDPSSEPARHQAALAYRGMGQSRKSEEHLWNGLKSHPESLLLRKDLGRLLIEQERWAEASDTIQTGILLAGNKDVELMTLAQSAKENLQMQEKSEAQAEEGRRPLVSLAPEELPDNVPVGHFTRPVGDAQHDSYEAYVPANYTKKKRWPLIIALHRKGERPDGLRDMLGHTLGEAKGFLIACPKAPVVQELQSDSSILATRDWSRTTVDAQVYNVLADLLAGYRLDLEQVMIMGFGSGGACAALLTLKHPGFFRGTVLIGADLPQWAQDMLGGARDAQFLLLTEATDAPQNPLGVSGQMLAQQGAQVKEIRVTHLDAGLPLERMMDMAEWWKGLPE